MTVVDGLMHSNDQMQLKDKTDFDTNLVTFDYTELELCLIKLKFHTVVSMYNRLYNFYFSEGLKSIYNNNNKFRLNKYLL